MGSALIGASSRRGVSTRVLVLAGTALAGVSTPHAARAQNVASNGTTSYSLNRTDTISGGPRTVDITTSGGDITLALATVNVDNQGANPRPTGSAAGAGIAGNNTGTGNVTISSAAVNATGPGQTYGIDARTTSGAITITSGTVNDTTSGSYGIVGSSSAGGAVSITADQTIGGTRGIFTSFTGGKTTITSNFATASAANTPNAIIGQGQTVIVNSKTATLTGTGSNGTAIFVQSGAGGATITSGTASTQGTGQYGIQFYSDSTGSLDSGSVTTAGANSIGIFANATTGNTVKSGSVVTAGANANGIYVSPSPTSGTNNTPSASPITITSGTITTTGANATGIVVSANTPNNNSNGFASTLTGATTITSDTINATGAGSSGIVVSGSTGSVAVTSNVINSNAAGISLTGGGAITVNATRTSTTAANASAIYVAPAANATVSINGGTLSTAGANAIALYAVGQGGALTTNTTAVTTTGADALGIYTTSGASPTTITSGMLASSGVGSGGIAANTTTGNIVINAGTTTTTGAYDTVNGNGVDAITAFGSGATGTASITSTNASAVGDYASAVFASMGGAVSITSGTASGAGISTDVIGGVSRTGDVTINAGTTTATGQGGIAIGATATAGNVTINAGTTSATGGQAITATAGKIASVTATSAAGGGDAAPGMQVTGGTGVVLNIGSASSNGTATTTTNSRTGVVTVRRSDAILATATTGTIAATIGSATATGAGADAVRLIANGTGGAVTATITGAVSSASGYGVFIDPPGANTLTIASGASVTGSTAGVSLTGATNSITNAGTIRGTNGAGIVATGATTLDNSGAIAGSGATAVQLGATNDTVTLRTGSAITGAIVGGGGTDAAFLNGTSSTATGAQTVAAFTGFNSLTVQNGYWTAPATATSSFATATVNAGGTLELANGAAGLTGVSAPSFVDNGALVVRSSAASAGSTFGAGAVTGSGTVLFTGTGTALLDGANTLANTGTITVDGGSTVVLTGTQGGTFATGTTGTLQIGTGGTTGIFTGSLADNGTLVVNHADTYTFGGALTGSGSVVKQGAGQLVFGSGYAFTGTTTIQGGSVKLTTPVAATTMLDVEGSGQFDLSGTTQTIAQLAGASTTASINIAGGSLTDNQNTNSTFAGSIVGNGSFTKAGTGRLNFTGTNTYTGPTTITGGILAVNGSIVSPVTVASGGTLGGTGTVGTTVVQSGGTYAPGNSIGTQTVAGNVTFAAGSVFQVEANAAGQADRVNATGTATLQGGTVQVLAATGAYNNLTSYTILTAAGGVSGQFAGTTSNLAFLTPFLSYSGTAVMLSLARNDVTFGSVGANRNQVATGNAVTVLGVNSAVYRALLPLSTTGAQSALGQLSGEIYASETAVLADSGRRLREAVLDHGSIEATGLGLWATGVGERADSRNENGTAPVSTRRYGTVGGIDFGMSGLRIGLDGGYIHDQIRVPTLASRADVDTMSAGAHVAYRAGPLIAQIGGTYEWHDVHTTRSLAAASLGSTAAANHGHTVQGFGELAYVEAMGPVNVTPFARFSYVDTRLNAVTETGGTGALAVAADKHHYEFGTLGLRLTGEAPVTPGVTLLPRISLAYTRGWDLDNLRTVSFAGTTSAFSIAGTPLGRDTLDVKGGLDLAFGHRLTLGAGFFGSTSRQWSDYGGQAAISLRF